MKNIDKIDGLYVILDPHFAPRHREVELAEAIIRGGAKMIQWRDKLRDKGEQLPILREIKRLCHEAGVLLIVNDHLDLALIADADGVHVGQKDLPASEVRRFLPKDKIVGVSTATLSEALKAQADGATYIAVGSIYPSPSKEKTRPAGLKTLREVKRAVSQPVVAIGGINQDNVRPVIKAGADAICVISAVLGSPHIEEATRTLRIKIEEAKGSKPVPHNPTTREHP